MGLVILSDSNTLQCWILIVTKACCEGVEQFRTFEVKHIILSVWAYASIISAVTEGEHSALPNDYYLFQRMSICS